MGEMEVYTKFWWESLKERKKKRLLGRLKRRWEDNIKTSLK
jgi:hypothetical protein